MSHKHNSTATKHFNKLIEFRQAVYQELGNACDALFELTDAVIQMRHIQSFVELSCAPAFRRKWPSAYEALQDGRPDREGMLQLYLRQYPCSKRLILAGDHSAWPRLWANTLGQRSYQHQPTPIPGRRPITIGHGYSTLTIIPQEHSSWSLPLLHERISNQKPVEKGAQQLRQVCQSLSVRPLSIWDAEYGCGAFLRMTADIKADKLIRLRTNLCLEGATQPYKGHGRRPRHGIPFKFKDPSTWRQPDQQFSGDDPEFGPLVVRIWKGLRFGSALDCPMVIALVERTQAAGSRRKPRRLWFAWVGKEPPAHWWSLYAQRYPVDHWYRFAKGRLHWTLPRLSTIAQAECWSDMMPFITWELWLAHELVEDTPLPWQKPQTQLSPGRVCQSMQNILVAIGTPTRVCKSRGKSPGWLKGQPRRRRPRFPLIRSEYWKAVHEREMARLSGLTPISGRPKRV